MRQIVLNRQKDCLASAESTLLSREYTVNYTGLLFYDEVILSGMIFIAIINILLL